MRKDLTDEQDQPLLRLIEAFREITDIKARKELTLSLLFLRVVSGPASMYCQRPQNDLTDNANFHASITVPQHASFHSLIKNLDRLDLVSQIDQTLSSIEDANSVMTGTFSNLTKFDSGISGDTKLKNRIVRDALYILTDSYFEQYADEDNDTTKTTNLIEKTIQIFAELSYKRADAFCTSESLSRLVSNLVSPNKGDSIYDPACGSASLLLSCARYVGKKSPESASQVSLFGQELNLGNWAIAKLNTLGSRWGKHSTLELGDSLRTPKFVDSDDKLQTFDVVVSNIPFSLRDWGYEVAHNDSFNRFQWGLPSKSVGDYAFISHMLTCLKAYGRMAVIVPFGALFRAGSEGKIRQSLIEENLLDAVVALPPKLLFSTAIPCAILVFRKNRDIDTVHFVNASEEFDPGKTQNRLSSDNIQRITHAIANREEMAGFSRYVSPDEIRDNDFNLNIARYITKAPDNSSAKDIPKLLSRQQSLKDKLSNLDNYLQNLTDNLNIGS